jgi:nucleoid DNA-binding protein
MFLIWKGFCEYLREKVTDYKGVNVKGLGAFTFEVDTQLPKIGVNYKEAKMKSFGELIMEKKTTHVLRPCFVVDTKFIQLLTRFKNKEELIKPKSQSSIYQKGFQMTYYNPIPIAAACFLSKNVIVDSLNAIFAAVYDLVNIGKNVILKTGFCNIYFMDKNLTYSFAPEICKTVTNLVESENKVINLIKYSLKEVLLQFVRLGKILPYLNGQSQACLLWLIGHKHL